MLRFLRTLTGALPAGPYVELVGSLFATRLPTLVMSSLFVMVGTLAVAETHDPVLLMVLVAGTIASVARVAVLLHDFRLFRGGTVPVPVAAAVERRFAATYLTFAAIMGVFGARSFLLPVESLHLAAAVLLIGYAAGVAAGTALRPWISITSLALAVVPTCIVAAATPDALYRASAICELGFLIGGVRSILQRYRSATSNIALRLAFSKLARQDHLTGLPNRLSLTEHFAKLSANGVAHQGLAVHCVDLDDFKPINDRFGHAAGDALLKAVANRLLEAIRGHDFVARLGGDEFIFVQTGIRQDHEAEAMAYRLERHLDEPYLIDGELLTVGASVGFAVSDDVEGQVESLIQSADDVLRERKARRKAGPGAPVTSIAAARLARTGAVTSPGEARTFLSPR